MLNLTEIALKYKSIVWYFIIVTLFMGIFSYYKLGRMEDPNFTVSQMIVSAAWPGASAEEMTEQVTDKLESRIRDLPGIDYIKSETRAGITYIYVVLRQDLPVETIRDTWRDVRNFCKDIERNLPSGVYGPYYNDRFDDVFGSIYGVTGDGYNYEELRKEAEKLRRLILKIDQVQKVELQGVQSEEVYIEIDTDKLMQFGVSHTTIAAALKTQNEMTPAGVIETPSDNINLRFNGSFDRIEDMKNLPINANGRIMRLGDFATVERRFSDPPTEMMYVNGKEAVGIAVSMEPGGNIITLGENLNQLVEEFQTDLPAGMMVERVQDQPAVVTESIEEFTDALREAIIIVLAASLISLGLRTGAVVALCIPLVLAATFMGMYFFGIDLQKVSLGALIISLGLLVDDEIIAVEMMSVQLERGYNRVQAACYAFTATAKPMLTGTLVTCAGFIPVAFSDGLAAEFCRTLFPVISIALLSSWIIAVVVAPMFGTYLIKTSEKPHNPYDSKFYAVFRKILVWCLEHRILVLGSTVALMVLSIVAFKGVRQEFFPPSIRPEIIVELALPEGASLRASQDVSARFSKFLDEHQDEIQGYSYYVGKSAPRFVLTLSPTLPKNNFSQFVIVSKNAEDRPALEKLLRDELADNYPEVRVNMKSIQTGPPAPYPVMVRISGFEYDEVQEYAKRIADRVADDPNTYGVHLDWNERSKIIRLELDQDKLRAIGIAPQIVAQSLYTELDGMTATQFYAGDRTINIKLRLNDSERYDIHQLKDLPIYVSTAKYVPLSQVAKISLDTEEGVVTRRNMLPTITVQGNIHEGTANDATKKALANIEDIKADLPVGYFIEPGGSLEDSQRSAKFLAVPLPAMVLVIATLLMLQLKRIRKAFLVALTAPLGIIGVSFGMLLFDKAMGFVAILGVLALAGMIIRNSIILIDQIDQHVMKGQDFYNAVIDSAILRFRPIMLTALAAILGMIPLMLSTFWGPMAVAIASGLFVATALTLLVLPVMYVVCYGIYEGDDGRASI